MSTWLRVCVSVCTCLYASINVAIVVVGAVVIIDIIGIGRPVKRSIARSIGRLAYLLLLYAASLNKSKHVSAEVMVQTQISKSPHNQTIKISSERKKKMNSRETLSCSFV